MEDVSSQEEQQSLEPKSSGNLILNLLLTTVVLGMGVYGYMYGNFGSITKKDLDNNYIKRSDVSFNTIPSSQKHNYIKKDNKSEHYLNRWQLNVGDEINFHQKTKITIENIFFIG